MISAFALYVALHAVAPQVPKPRPQDPAPVPVQGQTPPIQPKLTPVPLPPAVVLPGPPNVEPDAARPLSAEEATKIALRLHPSLDIARAQILAAQGRAQAAHSGLVPNISIGSSYDRVIDLKTGQTAGGAGGNNGSSSGGSSGGFNTSLTVNQLLFDFNHTRDLVRQSESLARAAQQGLTTAQNDLVLNVKNAFYTYVQNQRLVRTQEANLANTQAQLALAQARLDAGLGAPADVVQAQTAVGSASQLLAQARETALGARLTLAATMGIDPRTPISPSASEESIPNGDDLGAFVDGALKNRPEIRQIEETMRAAGYELSAARTTNAPSIGLSVSAGSRGNNDPLNNPQGTIGVSVNWRIGDGGQAAGLVKEAQADIMIAKANMTLVSQTVVQDVSQAYVTLRTAEQRKGIADSQVANASESLRLAEGRFRAGSATFLEVTSAQTALVAAQVAQINADTAIQQARAALKRAMGGV